MINENGREFPTYLEFSEMGEGGFRHAIYEHYGSICNAREMIGFNEIKRKELAKKLEAIVGEM